MNFRAASRAIGKLMPRPTTMMLRAGASTSIAADQSTWLAARSASGKAAMPAFSSASSCHSATRRAPATRLAMKLLVAATLCSLPACSGMVQAALCASGDSASFTSATVVAPPSRKYWIGSTTSGLWPDCEIEMARVSRVTSGDLYRVTSDIGSEVTRRPRRDMIR